MPSSTGYWNSEESLTNHDFSYNLAKLIGEYLPKDETLFDFGCGPGVYLRYLHDIGFENLLGLEGEPVEYRHFDTILKQDLAIPFNLEQWGNVLCLEVGEHIPYEYMDIFLDNITEHCNNKLILSWAIPSQGGFGHVNCLHNIEVIQEVEKRGFKLLVEDSIHARNIVEDRLSYFRNTILIFEK